MSEAPPHPPARPAAGTAFGLGLDAGGTQTRWALAAAGQPTLHAQGHAAALSGLQLDNAAGRAALLATLQDIGRQVHAACADPPGALQGVVAGVTGFDGSQAPVLLALMSQAFGLPLPALRAVNDIELTCEAATRVAGPCYVVYAGTGSVGAFLDEQGRLQRVGGRGAIIDDAGGGHWIARRALRQVWRDEDACPGAWRQSRLAQCLFARVGGTEWAHTRQWVYGASRGALGMLALAVAEAAEAGDAAALALLHSAGCELARLALVLRQRHGPRRVVLAGRAFDLHPAVQAGLCETLGTACPDALPAQRLSASVQAAAAESALRLDPTLTIP